MISEERNRNSTGNRGMRKLTMQRWRHDHHLWDVLF
jgi:hypothetical protein